MLSVIVNASSEAHQLSLEMTVEMTEHTVPRRESYNKVFKYSLRF